MLQSVALQQIHTDHGLSPMQDGNQVHFKIRFHEHEDWISTLSVKEGSTCECIQHAGQSSEPLLE